VTAPAIEVHGLVKQYGDLVVVNGIDLVVEPGTFVGLLGPNGAGKTTTMEMIEGLRKPDSGTIEVLGMPVWPRNPKVLPRIGVQLQSSAFFERLTAGEQLRAFADIYGMPAKRVDEMLELVGLTGKQKTRTEGLSGGQQQRLSLACALVHDPEVVFLDEPTAGLDPQARRNLWDVLQAINDRGHTVMLTTHFMDEAEVLCDEIAVMDNGKVLTSDRPRALIASLGQAHRILLDDHALPVEEAKSLPGVEAAVSDNGTLAITTHDTARVLAELATLDALDGLQVSGATLEDVFLSLTGREFRA